MVRPPPGHRRPLGRPEGAQRSSAGKTAELQPSPLRWEWRKRRRRGRCSGATPYRRHIACTFARQTADGFGPQGRSLHDVRQMYLGRLHTSRDQGVHRGVPHSPRADPTGALRRLSGPARHPAGAGGSALSALRRCSRRLGRRGTGVAPIARVNESPDASDDGPQQVIIYRFSVNRGMAIALVIETPDWYSGLLQSALARVRIEGQN
jgi:hypothetical protein